MYKSKLAAMRRRNQDSDSDGQSPPHHTKGLGSSIMSGGSQALSRSIVSTVVQRKKSTVNVNTITP